MGRGLEADDWSAILPWLFLFLPRCTNMKLFVSAVQTRVFTALKQQLKHKSSIESKDLQFSSLLVQDIHNCVSYPAGSYSLFFEHRVCFGLSWLVRLASTIHFSASQTKPRVALHTLQNTLVADIFKIFQCK